MTTSNTPPTSAEAPKDVEIALVVEGNISEADRMRAEAMIRSLARKAPRPVLFARVKLLEVPSRPPTQAHLAQGTIDVSGTLLRAQVAAPGMIDAINLLESRLERRLRDLADRRETAGSRAAVAEPGAWRSGDVPSARPAHFPRPRSEREIVRRKTWAGDRISLTDALFDLYVLDHRFFLFTDDGGMDAIVFEADGGVKLQRLSGDAPTGNEAEQLSVDVVESPAPEMSSDDAAERLDLSEEPFVFYRDTPTGRGCVLYRRYDGHYGLIEPRD
ncbi:MAG TPA: sigma 54 modulation/S30EA ribosomal C-terminal domain-containing protein [Acidimicrobiia bacterium]